MSHSDGVLRARCWSHDASMTGGRGVGQRHGSAASRLTAARPPLTFPLKPGTLIFFFNGYTSEDKAELQNQRGNNFSLAVVTINVESPCEQTRLWNTDIFSPSPLVYLKICCPRKEADYESKGGYWGFSTNQRFKLQDFWWRVEKINFLHIGVGLKVVLCWSVMPPSTIFPWSLVNL